MDKGWPLLQIRMFGTERITYGDMPILFGRKSVTKAMKLLLILLYSGEEGITRSKLLEALYGREELANAGNNLRVTMHRLKKMLVDEGLPEYEYIVSESGIYRWDSPMETVVDAVVFRKLIGQAKEQQDPEQKIALLKEACQMYSGEFLQKMSEDEWVLIESTQYKKLYFYALKQVTEYLMAAKEYDEVLRLVQPACDMYPFDEWQSTKIDCFIAMHRYTDALAEYEATAKLLIEELGITPSERMMRQFREMSEHITNRPQMIGEIKEGLKEKEWEKGAFFCTVPGFRDAYRMVCRSMERTGQSVYLLLCTLVDSKGRPMENSEKLEQMSEGLYFAIKNSLRRCDSFTKYNQAQFLVMLLGTNEENCQIVIDRITKNYAAEHKSWAQCLECSVASLLDF